MQGKRHTGEAAWPDADLRERGDQRPTPLSPSQDVFLSRKQLEGYLPVDAAGDMVW